MSENVNITSYRSRRLRPLGDLDEIKADLKELDLEAKAYGLNVPELRKWVDAEHRDKVGKRITDTVDAVLYGESLGHDLGMAPNNEDRIVENGSKVPPYDPATGEVRAQ